MNEEVLNKMKISEEQISEVFERLRGPENDLDEEVKKKQEEEYLKTLTPKSKRKYLKEKLQKAKNSLNTSGPLNPLELISDPKKFQRILSQKGLNKNEIMKNAQSIMADREKYNANLALFGISQDDLTKVTSKIVGSDLFTPQ